MINRADIFPSRAIRLGGQKLIRPLLEQVLVLVVLVVLRPALASLPE